MRRKKVNEHIKQLIIMHHVKHYKNDGEIANLLGLGISTVRKITNNYWRDKMIKKYENDKQQNV